MVHLCHKIKEQICLFFFLSHKKSSAVSMKGQRESYLDQMCDLTTKPKYDTAIQPSLYTLYCWKRVG